MYTWIERGFRAVDNVASPLAVLTMKMVHGVRRVITVYCEGVTRTNRVPAAGCMCRRLQLVGTTDHYITQPKIGLIIIKYTNTSSSAEN